jgi:hypothetical protein
MTMNIAREVAALGRKNTELRITFNHRIRNAITVLSARI